MLAAIVIGAGLAILIGAALAWKWQLGIARAVAVTAVLALVAALVALALAEALDLGDVLAGAVTFAVTVLLATALLAYRFYRDPERTAPEGTGLVLSPADGEVVYVREAPGGVLPVSSKLGRDYELQELTRTPLASEDNVVIGIALSFLDVHVNRAPISGRVSVARHFAGRFGSLRRPEMVFENERATLVIDGADVQLAVVLIASRLVRRIVTFVGEGDELIAGQRIGVIRFGSQVDVVLPLRDDVRVTVSTGDRVVAGATPIAEFDPIEARATRALEHAERR